MLPAGKSLRTLREKLGLTMRDIEMSSARMAEKYRNEEFSIPPSRLSDIETKGVLPSIFRLYTLAVIYRRDLRELLSWYGVDLSNMAADLGMIAPRARTYPRRSPRYRRCKCRSAWIPASTKNAQAILDAWLSSGVWCRSPISRNSRTVISRMDTSAIRISRCIRFCRLEVLSRSMKKRIKWRRERGDQSMSVRFTLWKLERGTLAAGAACDAMT